MRKVNWHIHVPFLRPLIVELFHVLIHIFNRLEIQADADRNAVSFDAFTLEQDFYESLW